MRLKSIEMYGFKSFADKTVVDLDHGLTVVVGPNGCGKSNVVDALKWVLGEQSVSSLRGKEMADVIFNGTNRRHALGYAEVSLNIDNNLGALGVDFTEVKVTRRVYRSGEGEYFINKRPCRLKDVKELFMDTGLGSNSYSILEQGSITAILQANPIDRRVFFEEAAGISKYKAKRKETLRRLERVEQNLLRVSDITSELEKQLGSIRRQASKARRYKEMADKLKQLRIALALNNYKNLTETLTKVVNDLNVNQVKLEEVKTKISSGEAEYAIKQEQVLSLETKIQTLEKEVVEIDVRLENFEKTISESKQMIAEFENNRNNIEESMLKYQDDIALMSEDLQTFDQRGDAIKAEKTAMESDILAATEVVNNIGKASREALENIENMRKENLRLVEEKSATLGQIGQIDMQMSNVNDQNAYVLERTNALDCEIRKVSSEHEGQLSMVSHAREELNAHQHTSRLHQENLDKLLKERKELDEAVKRTSQQLWQQSSRLKALEGMEASFEGLYGGVKSVMVGAERNELHGIRGLVADIIEVDNKYNIAIETALGGKGQNIITNTNKDAKLAVEFLKKNRAGRATFIPLDNIRYDKSHNVPRANGVLGRAADLVTCSAEFTSAVEYLLGRILVIDTLDNALAVSRQKVGYLLVTLDGESINPRGAITGGSRAKNSDGGLLQRKNEIKRLTELSNNLERELNRDKLALNKSEEAYSKALSEFDTFKESKLNLERQLFEGESVLRQLNENLSRLTKEKTQLQDKSGTSKQSLSELLGEKMRLESQLESLENKHSDIQSALSFAEESIAASDEKRRIAEEKLTQLKINNATIDAKINNFSSEKNRLTKAIGERKELLNDLLEEKNNRGERTEILRQRIVQSELSIKEFLNSKETGSARLRELINERESVKRTMDAFYLENKEVIKLQKDLENNIQHLRIKEGESQIKLDNLRETVRDNYGLNIDEAFQTVEYSELDWSLARKEIKELDDSIRRLGPVNMEAIEEETELEQRFEFLTAQITDLTSSKEQLLAVIAQINKDSRELFGTTFKAIQENFAILFRKFFGGGKAELRLDGDDILEAGVEIMVRPPGKQPSTMDLLSGGEKTMTTIALLFAIYRSKPSPFCVLDEVDAPLDESNIDRFVSVVKELLNTSQFMIVSHNKRTIGMGDCIYGVTMQETGVSRLLSMKYEEAAAVVEDERVGV